MGTDAKPSQPDNLTTTQRRRSTHGRVQPEAVTAILLSDGRWHACQDLKPEAITGSLKWPASFRFKETDDLTQERWVTLPASSVLAVRTRHIETAEERAEREAERAALAAETFKFQHYCDSATYDRLYAEQGGYCPKCNTLLDNARFVHYYEGQLLDRDNFNGCSPLTPRYGLPN